MDAQITGVITILRSAINGEALPLPESFDVEKACTTLYMHHMLGLGIQGIVRCGVPRSHPAVSRMMGLFCQNVNESRLQIKKLRQVYDAFEAAGVDYMPLKGAVLKEMYPQPELRRMGDADILIRERQYPAIREILMELGYQEGDMSDHRYSWEREGFEIEIHRRLIPSTSADYFRYYSDGWRFAQPCGEGARWCMRDEDHYIYLLVHFAKHYRSGGVVIKNICDFWFYRKACPHMDEAYIRRELENLQLWEFYRNILDVLKFWFEGAQPTAAAELITETVFADPDADITDRNIVVTAMFDKANSRRGGRIRLAVKRMFPSARQLENRYPVLGKCPWLLPLMWICRWIGALVEPQQRSRSLEYFRKLQNADNRKLTAYEQRLRQVGLGFRFDD